MEPLDSSEQSVQQSPPKKLPKIAAACPYRVQLIPGQKYKYCTCGLSKKQPFCDNAHIGTDFKPIIFSVQVQQSFWYLCGCKHNRPEAGYICDGSHINLDW